MTAREAFDAYFDHGRIETVAAHYHDYVVPRVSLGSVRDYCDSFDNLGPLASHQEDLKDVQRCWMLKAVLATYHAAASWLRSARRAGDRRIAFEIWLRCDSD